MGIDARGSFKNLSYVSGIFLLSLIFLFASVSPSWASNNTLTTPSMSTIEGFPDASDLQLLDEKKLSNRLVELTFQTPALATPTKVRILLPSD